MYTNVDYVFVPRLKIFLEIFNFFLLVLSMFVKVIFRLFCHLNEIFIEFETIIFFRNQNLFELFDVWLLFEKVRWSVPSVFGKRLETTDKCKKSRKKLRNIFPICLSECLFFIFMPRKKLFKTSINLPFAKWIFSHHSLRKFFAKFHFVVSSSKRRMRKVAEAGEAGELTKIIRYNSKAVFN